MRGRKRTPKSMRLKTLKEQLRSLADVPVPEEVESKILSKILPNRSAELKTQKLPYKWEFNLGAVAAVIILFIALMLMVNLSMPSASANRTTLPHDTTLCYPNSSLNYYSVERSDLTEDINYVNVIDF